MNLQGLLTAAIGIGAKTVTTASTIGFIAGTAYLLDCRVNTRSSDNIDRCWMTALPIMGISAGIRGGFAAGYNTYNPTLRRPDEFTPESDDRGR